MAGADAIKVEGEVVESLASGLYRVTLANGHRVLAHGREKVREQHGRLAPGDKVILEMSPFDLAKGRITAENEK